MKGFCLSFIEAWSAFAPLQEGNPTPKRYLSKGLYPGFM